MTGSLFTPPAPPAGGRSRRRSAHAGFTLVELTVSLVAGLMVAMAVMGVSKEATNTFHEEVRVSGAEMGLRVAMERIRLDLQRAAFMGTGNVLGDPMIAHLANYAGPNPPVNLSNFGGGVLPYSLNNLSGVALFPHAVTPAAGVVVAATVVSDATASPQLAAQVLPSGGLPAGSGGLLPDAIDIAGNMSSSDEYAASIVWNPTNPAPPAGCAGQAVLPGGAANPGAAIQLEMTSPAGWRIRNAETLASLSPGYVPGVALRALFHPGNSTSSSFLLRVTDQSGRYQYVVGCPGALPSATYVPAPGATILPTATLYISNVSALLSSNVTGGLGGIGGFGAGLVTVSPVEVTRWNIQTAAQLTTAAAAAGAGGANTYFYNQTATAFNDPTDFLLTRSYVDVSSACPSSAPCPVDPFTTEVISEYAVDLKFGLTVDSFPNPACGATTFPCPTVAPSYTTQPLINLPMDSAPTTFSGWGAVEGAYTGSKGPQRIRDVQVRIGIRSPFGDRSVTLPVQANSAVPTGYLYRYLLSTASTNAHFQAGTPYARVREATTEVNLPNQARFYW